MHSIPRYQQNGYEEDEDVDGITEAQRNEAAQVIANIQSMTDDQVTYSVNRISNSFNEYIIFFNYSK